MSMISLLKAYLIKWNNEKSDLSKVQLTYLIVSLFIIMIAGVISLVNNRLGQSLIAIPLLFGATFLVNLVVDSLLESIVIKKIKTFETKKSKKTVK